MDLDPEVHRYLFTQPADAASHREAVRQRMANGWPPVGGLWMVEWRDAPGLLGWCGLFPLQDSGLIEIGYRYVRATWGRGVATEAGSAVLDHGFRSMGFDPIVAVVHPENQRSQRVVTKLGLASLGTAFHYQSWLNFYRLDRNAYLANTG